jgi:simple sugar transport system permease protein
MLVPALARAYLSVDEIITTLMLNFVATLWLAYWATGPWHESGQEQASGALFSRTISDNAQLGEFQWGTATVSVGLFIALALPVVLWAVFRYSHYGFRATLTGSGDDAGTYAGVRTRFTRLSVLLFSGAVAGFAGTLVLVDRVHSFSSPITADDPGYLGIVVALLAANSFLASIPMALFMAAIIVSGNALQIAGVSPSIVFLVTGVLVLFAASANVLGRIGIRRAAAAPPGAGQAPAAPLDPPAAAEGGAAR